MEKDSGQRRSVTYHDCLEVCVSLFACHAIASTRQASLVAHVDVQDPASSRDRMWRVDAPSDWVEMSCALSGL